MMGKNAPTIEVARIGVDNISNTDSAEKGEEPGILLKLLIFGKVNQVHPLNSGF